ncbi:MAG: aminodeoxychorismate synthase component I [Lentisphaerae bacterium]|nr:aminodeoxychorismate synthase component I [Lentisphaerota bacterium]
MSCAPLQPGTVILRDTPTDGEPRWLAFADPVRVLSSHTPSGVLPLLRQVEEAVAAGLTAAGFLAYEAASAFDPAARTRPAQAAPHGLPLAWFGLYRQAKLLAALPPAASPPPDLHWTPSESYPAFATRIERIRRAIAEGDTYQVNYTFRLRAAFAGDPWALFLALDAVQQGRYAAWLRLDHRTVCCTSPELFFRLDGDRILCRPMKGTAPRGATPAEDRALRAALRRSLKDQAENVMIVDMMRNDLGRLARPGTVRVPRRFRIEPYPTVWQMTSDVEAQTRVGLADLFTALFPCASITGAPKIRTMELIAGLEDGPRGVYTGAIGFVAPGRRAQFNVAIRTVTVDQAAATAEYGTGGGIVWDSRAPSEYAEALAKSRILAAPPAGMCLFETLLWRPRTGWFLLRGHLRRLAASARLLGFRYDEEDLRRRLEASVTGARSPRRVKLILPRGGPPVVETAPAPLPPEQPWRVTLARDPVDPDLPLLRHKTTCRGLYEAARAGRPGFDDVLLWNTRGELTESTIANLALRIGGRWYTPPLSAGLLPGVFRAHLLRANRVAERTLHVGDLRSAEALALFNSLRGWIPALACPPGDGSIH